MIPIRFFRSSLPLIHSLRNLLLVFAFLGAHSAFAGGTVPGYKFDRSDEPDNTYEGIFHQHKDVAVDYYSRVSEGNGPVHKIFLRSVNHPAQREFLFAYDRGAEVDISPDENRIIVNVRELRGECDPRLFVKEGGLKYLEEKSAGIHGKAVDSLIKNNALPPEIEAGMMEPGGSFVESTGHWAGDSSAVLLRISKQQTGGPVIVTDWLCIYDFSTGEITRDLEALDRGACKLLPK